MSFEVVKLVKLTIKGKEDFYSESEIKELRDMLLKTYPLEEKTIVTGGARTPFYNVKDWEKRGTTYIKDKTKISANFVDTILKYFIENKNEKFLAKSLKDKFSSTNSKTYGALGILQQEGKIEKIYEKAIPYYTLKKITYSPQNKEDKLQVISEIPDLSALREASIKNMNAMREK